MRIAAARVTGMHDFRSSSDDRAVENRASRLPDWRLRDTLRS
jgi:hypothetical protein